MALVVFERGFGQRDCLGLNPLVLDGEGQIPVSLLHARDSFNHALAKHRIRKIKVLLRHLDLPPTGISLEILKQRLREVGGQSRIELSRKVTGV